MRIGLMVLALCPAPAMAQLVGPIDARPAPRAPSSYRLNPRTTASDPADVRERIRDGRRSGQLSRADARAFRRETGQLDALSERYGAT